MMRPKSLMLLGLAVGCGLVASIGISQVLDSNKGTAVEMVPIYVALQNINLGDPIGEDLVSLQEWPKDKVPVGAIADWEAIEDRRPRTIIFQGEPLLEGKLLDKGQTQDAIRGIPKSMRLKTVSVDARKSVAGLLSPGDRVDVQLYVHRNTNEGIDRPFTKIILQNIRVYAVDQSIARSVDGVEGRTVAKTVSLVVTPQQANRLATAENLGDLSLIPRNPDDDIIIDDEEQNVDDLLGRSTASNRKREQGKNSDQQEGQGLLNGSLQQSVAPALPPVKKFQMKIIYPNEVKELQFSDETGEPIGDDPQESSNSAGAAGSDPKDADAAASDDDFPIEFEAK